MDMIDQITVTALKMYGFSELDPTTAQGGDSYVKDGFMVSQVEDSNEWITSPGMGKEDVSTVEDLQRVFKERKGYDLVMKA